MQVCACGGSMWNRFLCPALSLYHIPLRLGLSTNLKCWFSPSLADQQASGVYLSLLPSTGALGAHAHTQLFSLVLGLQTEVSSSSLTVSSHKPNPAFPPLPKCETDKNVLPLTVGFGKGCQVSAWKTLHMQKL